MDFYSILTFLECFILYYVTIWMTEDRWLDSITDSMDMSLIKLCKMVKDSEAWRAAVHAVTKSQT